MPWNKSNYPDSMKNLPAGVRNKAIEIANALLEERNMNEGIAIATGISRAKDWAEEHGKKSKAAPGTSKTTDVKHHGEDRYVTPDKEGWVVKKEGTRNKQHFENKKDAVTEARKAAKDENASVTIQRKDGKVQSRTSYNPNKRARKQS